MSKTTHYELNTPIGSEVLSVMTGLNPNFNTIDGTMYDNEVRSTQALNKANVNEQNIATALGRITTAEGDIDTLESGLETANTNISGLTSRMGTAESSLVTANNRITENAGEIAQINNDLSANFHSGSATLTFDSYGIATLNHNCGFSDNNYSLLFLPTSGNIAVDVNNIDGNTTKLAMVTYSFEGGTRGYIKVFTGSATVEWIAIKH